MKILGKSITAALMPLNSEEDVLFGIQVTNGICECCVEPVKVTRIGFGLGEVDIFIQ